MHLSAEQVRREQLRLTPRSKVGSSKPRADVEHEEQVALFDWAELMRKRYPELKWMFAIPNGGMRSAATAGKLKAEGVKAGVLDIFLPAARGGFYGLFIEMKALRNTPSAKQLEFATAVENAGYACYVCYGWDKAAQVIEAYLEGRPVIGRTQR